MTGSTFGHEDDAFARQHLPEQSAAVWVVDDDRAIRWVLTKALAKASITAKAFDNAADALDALKRMVEAGDSKKLPLVLVSDIRMPGMSGVELLEKVKALLPTLPVIIMTAYTDLESAVSSFQGGAFEYLTKPFDVPKAVALIQRAMEESSVRHEEAQSLPVESVSNELPLIGHAPAMQDVFRAIGRLSQSNVTVLLTGESGAGKEVVARAIWKHSRRSRAPFIAINMAAIPRELLESELFGHEKGAFTGATSTRLGRFEQAKGGTLFLDEIGDMPYDVQVTLLRVLQTQTVTRIGGTKPIQIDVRIVSATNKDLRKCIENHTFREDLYYRLNVFTIPLPPLRERGRDIEEIARYFLTVYNKIYDKHVADISEDVLRAFHAYRWPGNIRELENVMERAVILCKRDYVTLIDIPDAIGRRADEAAPPLAVGWPLRHERERIESALKEHKGNMSHAAKELGMSRPTLYKRVKEYGIDKRKFE